MLKSIVDKKVHSSVGVIPLRRYHQKDETHRSENKDVI